MSVSLELADPLLPCEPGEPETLEAAEEPLELPPELILVWLALGRVVGFTVGVVS